MKSKTTATILAIFGLHYFYLNRIGLALLFWIFVWAPIVWVWWIIDIVRFACMSDAEFNAKYNTYYMPTPTNNTNNNTQNMSVNVGGGKDEAAQLKTYSELKEKGVITEEEFELKKKELLHL
jgi:TM2 domain-containing membrane protein YozV